MSTSTAKEPTVAQTASQQQGERDLSQVKVLTLDVGGSAIKYGVCNGLGELSFKGQEPTPNEPDSKVEDLINAFKWIVQKVKDEGGEFEGIAISVPGCVNADGSLRTGVSWKTMLKPLPLLSCGSVPCKMCSQAQCSFSARAWVVV